MAKKNLQASYDRCEAIIKEHSKSFYLAFSQLPKPKNKAVYALYAFCRMADDLVDNASTAAERARNIEQFSTELELFFEGQYSDNPIWVCLADVFARYPMSQEAFRLQIQGQKLDIEFSQPETLDDLLTYSYHVASSVGLMMLPIIAQENYRHLEKEAINLGIAMQITNILRDVGEDYQTLNRIYLPRELMNKFNVTEDMIRNKETTDAFIDLWEHLAQIAEGYYDSFQQQITLFDPDCQTQLTIAAKVYAQLLTVIRENQYSCLSKRNMVSKRTMAKIVKNSQHN